MSNRDEMPDTSGNGDSSRPSEEQPTANGNGEAHTTTPPQREARHTRTAGTWAAVVVATIALIVLMIFILQNLQPVTVTFLGVRGGLPLGVALLLAAAIGGLLVALVGVARILQLRRSGRTGKH